MNAISYVQMNLIPIVVLSVVCHDMKKRLVLSKNNRLLVDITLGLICLFVVDAGGWICDGATDLPSRMILWASDMIYYALIGILPYLWVVYSMRRIVGEYDRQFNTRMIILAMPLIIHIGFLVLTPLTGAYFTIDENNVYHRGSFLIVQQIVSTGYMLFGTVMAFVYRRHARTVDKKRECLFMALLFPLPLIMAILQIFFYGTSLFLPGAALAEVFLYLDILHYQVVLDGMTGLNNRRSLDEYLIKRIDRANAYKGALYVLLIDINYFKSINDTYGHVEGDKAICLVSITLKYCFSKTDAFISRYGGDEFAVAVNCKDTREINAIVDKLHMPIKSWKPDAREPLFLSVGVTKYEYSYPTTPERLLREADDEMYLDKQRTKKLSGGAK